MRLDVARLCLDCDEVHDGDRCPACGSETFAFLKRWVPPGSGEGNLRVGRSRPSGGSAEQVKTYQQLLESDRTRSRKRGLVTRGALGLMMLGLARLAWRVGQELKCEIPRHKTPSAKDDRADAGKAGVAS